MNKDSFPKVYVEWIDSQTSMGWEVRGEEDIKEPILVMSTGYLINYSKDTILLVGDLEKGGQSNRAITIPQASIKSINILIEDKSILKDIKNNL